MVLNMYLDYISYARFSLLKLSSLLQKVFLPIKIVRFVFEKWLDNPTNSGLKQWPVWGLGEDDSKPCSNDEQLANNLPRLR